MSERNPTDAERESEIERLCMPHAPLPDARKGLKLSHRVRRAIDLQAPIEAVVMTVDIRRSEAVLKESIDVGEYARVLNDFVCEFRTVLAFHNGWFDKFTGDGFICYWLPEGKFVDTLHTALAFASAVMDNFRTYYTPAFMANMRNIPANIGLSVGVDAGMCYLAPIADNLTLIGAPIVGSVRMATHTTPYRLILNAYPGGRLVESMPDEIGRISADLRFTVQKHMVKTKEYAEGQVSYLVEFLREGEKPLS